MKKDKDDIKAKSENNEKVIRESTITTLNVGIQKTEFMRPVNENRAVYERPRSVSILNPYKKPRGCPCKGPPGRTRSPGIDYGYFTEHPPSSAEKLKTAFNKKLLFTQDNILTDRDLMKFKFLLFYKHLNFTIMKKQFLSFVIIALAVFASISSAFGQVTYTNNITGAGAIYCTPALPLACTTDNELNPIPGKSYTYTVTVPAGSLVHWFVTDQSTVVDGTGAAPVVQADRDVAPNGEYILTASAGIYNVTTNPTATIDMSWKYFDGTANQVLLVAHVTDAAGCTNNVEVYRIRPAFAFTLDIASILDNGAVGDEECLSPVESATYDGTNLTTNYGENWVFFSVNAANFVHSWQPTFTVIDYNGGGGTGIVPAADIQWAYPADAKANLAWKAVTVPVEAQGTPGGAVGAAGECIIVRVRVDHANNGNVNPAIDPVLTFGVDGVMYNFPTTNYANANLQDLDNVATAPCTNTVTDQATYTLTRRPNIVSATGTPVLNFEPKN